MHRRFLLFVADAFVLVLMLCISWFLLQDQIGISAAHWAIHGALLMACIGIFLLLFRCYNSLWRYAESREYLMQFFAVACGFSLYMTIDLVALHGTIPCPVRPMLFATLMSLVAMWAFRFMYRCIRQAPARREYSSRSAISLLIIGAGDAGVALADEILRTPASNYRVYGFLDDAPIKQNVDIHGMSVLGAVEDIDVVLKDSDVKEIVVAIPSLTEERRREILARCSVTGCRVRMLPRVTELLYRSTAGLLNSVRDIQVEDLLGRQAVEFENREVHDFLSGKVVLVTGGGGSIGSELCRQIATHHPKRLIVLDIYENNAYDLQQELRYLHGERLNLQVEIASVRDREKVNLLFDRYRPQIVFHAAAHKHVPLMEDCPDEAIKNNVFGTYNVALAASAYGAEKFILISTDKAVNPTNVMGASKRLCEMVMQGMQGQSSTRYVAVRFGNVLGSNGSVIPLFKRQIARGGPITLTDRRIIRYFMTIPEAAQLVMQAGVMADSSQVFVLDMGEPVKILTLAENLVRLAGLTPYVDVDIIETGLRPGEKLYEELLMKSEHLSATKNQKIFIEQQEPIDRQTLERYLEQLQQALDTRDGQHLVSVMRQIVPTFKTPEEVNTLMESVNLVEDETATV